MPSREEYLLAMQESRGGWQRTDYSVRRAVRETKIGIASDVHIPFHDERLVADMLATFEEHGVEAIVWLGDLLDLPYFSKYDQIDRGPEWKRDSSIAELIIRMASKVVDYQYISRGNHDERALRKMGFQIDMTDLIYMLGLKDLVDVGRLVVSDNPSWSYLSNTWLLTHPEQYGNQPLVVPGKMADLEQKNVVAGHAHHWAHGVSPSSLYQVIESGGLFNPRYFEYVQHRPTTARRMTPGYWILDNGQALGFRGADRV